MKAENRRHRGTKGGEGAEGPGPGREKLIN